MGSAAHHIILLNAYSTGRLFSTSIGDPDPGPHVLMGLPNPDPLVRGTDPDPDPLVKRCGSGSAPKWGSATLVSTPFLQISFFAYTVANSLQSSVLDRHRFDADPDQNPTFYYDAYPYLDPDP